MRDRSGVRRTAARLAAVCRIAVCLAAPLPATAQAVADTGWIPLFNGRDLDGWTVKITGREPGDDPARTFRVEAGLLKVVYDGYTSFGGAFGHLFYRTPFSHYRLRVEYRFVGEQVPGGPEWALRNSGVMVHSQPPSTLTRDQQFPVSIEFQFLGGTGAGERSTGNLCTPGTNVVMDGQLVTRHCTSSRSGTWHGDRWVTAEIEVHGGGHIRHLIDGQVVLEYDAPQLDPADADAKRLIHGADLILREGWIALQSESHPIEFRKVEIRVISPPPSESPGKASHARPLYH
jgi:hypothetical protein